MEVSARQKWLAVSLIAVVIPVSLWATLKLTEMLCEPQTIAETIEMEAVALEFDRPVKSVKAPAIANDYVDENVLIDVSMPFTRYCDRGAVGSRDCVETSLWINATALHGFVHSVEFSCNVDSVSWIMDGNYHYIKMYNATAAEHNATMNWMHFKFKVSNSPAAMHIPLSWIYLEDDGSVDHQLSLSIGTVYYNGTAYREVIIPFKIEVTRDVGNTFEDAKLIGASESVGSLDSVDRIDVYAAYLQEDETINVTLIPPKEANFDLYLYNKNHEELAKSDQAENRTETITYKATQTEIYYITLEYQDWPGYQCEGIYQLKVEIP